jgi:hypothetical protein
MSQPTALEQLGRFIVKFQNIEAALTVLLVLMSNADDEFIRILVNELEYRKRVSTTGVLFAYFVDLNRNSDQSIKKEFHDLMAELLKLGEVRNEFVHSKYCTWFNSEGKEGLIRVNSKLKGKDGVRETKEIELLPNTFDADLSRLTKASQELEKFRLKIIEWL